MGLLSGLLLVIFAITAILLVAIVLMQDEGGEGLGGIFGGGGSTQQVGNRSGNILTRTTAILGAVFLLTAFGLAWLNRTPEAGSVQSVTREAQGGQSQSVEWWRTDTEEDQQAAEETGSGGGDAQGLFQGSGGGQAGSTDENPAEAGQSGGSQ